MNNFASSPYRVCEISDLDAISAFRQTAYASDVDMSYHAHPTLISDRWDEFSFHLGLLYGNQLVGAVRFAPPISGQLPVHDYVPMPVHDYFTDASARSQIRELSRGLIHPKHRNVLGAAVLARAIYNHILNDPTHILVDVLVNSTKTRTAGHLLRMGLIDTGIRYWDGRYRSTSAVMLGTRSTIVSNIKEYLSS